MHLKRDFLGILKIGQATHSEDALAFAQTMETLRKRLMARWYQYKEGHISRAGLINKAEPIIHEIKKCLKDYAG